MADTTARTIDFSNVKEGGSFNKRRVPSGDYPATIVKVTDSKIKKEGENQGEFQYEITIALNDKRYGSGKYPYYCPLVEKQLWKLRNILVAAGFNVPKSRMKVDPNKLVGKTIGVTMEDDDYNGREQSSVAAIFPVSEIADYGDTGGSVDDDGDDDGEEAPEPVEEEDEAEPEDEPAEDEATDPVADMDRTELKAAIKAIQSDFVAKKSQSDDDLREILRGLQAPKAAAGDDDLEELDIDDEV